MKGYLEATCDWSNHEVARWRSVAATVDAHSQIGEAWMAGHIGARVVQVGGALDVSAFGGNGVSTDEMIDIFQTFCGKEFDKDVAERRELHSDTASDHDLSRTAAQRSFDALLAIFRTAADAGTAGDAATAVDTVVDIVIDAATFGRMLASAGLAPTTLDGITVDPFTGLPTSNTLLPDLMSDPAQLGSIRCETDRGVPVHTHDVLRAALAGHVRRVVLDGDGHVIDYGRKKRLFEGPARDAAKLLVRRCEHPGCDLPSDWSDIDHNQEWNELGETNQGNAGVLCSSHNRAKHRLELRRRRGANGFGYTVRADGSVIVPIGARTPQFPAEDDPDDRPDTPEEIAEMADLVRQRLHAALARDQAA